MPAIVGVPNCPHMNRVPPSIAVDDRLVSKRFMIRKLLPTQQSAILLLSRHFSTGRSSRSNRQAGLRKYLLPDDESATGPNANTLYNYDDGLKAKHYLLRRTLELYLKLTVLIISTCYCLIVVPLIDPLFVPPQRREVFG